MYDLEKEISEDLENRMDLATKDLEHHIKEVERLKLVIIKLLKQKSCKHPEWKDMSAFTLGIDECTSCGYQRFY